MRILLQVTLSLFSALCPVKLLAPPHQTPEPSIPWLIVRSAVRHRVPIDLALHRGWAESGWKNLVNQNRQKAWDVGAMQVNSKYHPEVFAMETAEQIDLGVSVLRDCLDVCGNDYGCAERVYTRGHK